MLNFFKHKSFLKISTLLLISLSVFFFLFLKENLNFKISGYKEKNSSIINNIISDYNNFFEIKKITLNGRKEADLNKIKKIINSDLSEKNNLIEYDIRNIKISIENLKWIDKVFVRKVLPDQIIINIEDSIIINLANLLYRAVMLRQETTLTRLTLVLVRGGIISMDQFSLFTSQPLAMQLRLVQIESTIGVGQ